jgi:uncharacterized protein YuzE
MKINTNIIPMLLDFPSNNIWIDFDEEADVLYISYEKPQKANDSILEDDGNIYNYRDERVVGITVLNVKRYITNN